MKSTAALAASKKVAELGAMIDEGDADEDELEAAMEELLDAEMSDEYDDDDDDDGSDFGFDGENENSDLNSESDDKLDAVLDTLGTSKTGHAAIAAALAVSQENISSTQKALSLTKNDPELSNLLKGKSTTQTSNEPPSNFSRIDTSLSLQELQEQFPLFVTHALKEKVEVVLHPGQMLYLPAGWFHEVFSSNEDDHDMYSSSQDKARDSGHAAFNFWFHPPDAVSANHACKVPHVATPYMTSFWSDDMQLRFDHDSKADMNDIQTDDEDDEEEEENQIKRKLSINAKNSRNNDKKQKKF